MFAAALSSDKLVTFDLLRICIRKISWIAFCTSENRTLRNICEHQLESQKASIDNLFSIWMYPFIKNKIYIQIINSSVPPWFFLNLILPLKLLRFSLSSFLSMWVFLSQFPPKFLNLAEFFSRKRAYRRKWFQICQALHLVIYFTLTVLGYLLPFKAIPCFFWVLLL